MKTKNTAWTAEEEAALAKAATDNVSPARLSVRLQRSEASIKRRMRELGLAGKRREVQQDVTSGRIRNDPGVIVNRWLEACRLGDLPSLLELYDADATLECACTGPAIYAGLSAIQQYWAPKLRSSIPRRFSLLGTRIAGERGVIEYLSFEAKPVTMHILLNSAGKIIESACGPLACGKLAA